MTNDLANPMSTWFALLAVLVGAQRAVSTSDIMRASYELTAGNTSIHLNHVSRVLERLEDAKLVESTRNTSDGGRVTVSWSATQLGRETFATYADTFARVGAISPPKGPPA